MGTSAARRDRTVPDFDRRYGGVLSPVRLVLHVLDFTGLEKAFDQK